MTMAAMSTAMAVAGSAVAAPAATTFSSSATLGASSGGQQLAAVRSPASFNGARMVAVRASQSSHEDQVGVKSKVLVALVAAGAAMALNVAPVAPAYAGWFGNDNVKVERGAGSDFPSNEGVGNKVGSNSDVRGAASTGTPVGEGAGGSLVGDNTATRQASSSGTPLGEGNINTGSGVNLTDALKVPDVSIPNPLDNVGDLNPLKNGLPDVGNLAKDAKSNLPNASSIASDAQNAVGDAKNKVTGASFPNPSSVASDAKTAAQDATSKVSDNLPTSSSVASNAAQDVKNKLGGSSNVYGSAKDLASDVASSDGAQGVKGAAGEVAKNVDGAKSSLPNPLEAGKSLFNKVTGN